MGNRGGKSIILGADRNTYTFTQYTKILTLVDLKSATKMNKTGVKGKKEAKRMAQVKKSSWGVLARGDCSY